MGLTSATARRGPAKSVTRIGHCRLATLLSQKRSTIAQRSVSPRNALAPSAGRCLTGEHGIASQPQLHFSHRWLPFLWPLRADVMTVSAAFHHLWIEAKLVCEVAFAEMTADEQVRQTTFLGWTDDKKPEELSSSNDNSTGPETILGLSAAHLLFASGGPTLKRCPQ